MIINNQILHTHEIVALLTPSMPELPKTICRIKFNGKFVQIKNKNGWVKISHAKSAFKYHIRRYSYVFREHLILKATHYYQLNRSDIDAIFNQLIADNILEFVETSN